MSSTTKPAIVASAKETFQANYLHYIGNLTKAEIFYQYQAQNILHLRDVITIFRNNAQILKRARSQYRMRYWDPESLGLIIYLLNKNIRAVAGTQAKQLATFMRHS